MQIKQIPILCLLIFMMSKSLLWAMEENSNKRAYPFGTECQEMLKRPRNEAEKDALIKLIKAMETGDLESADQAFREGVDLLAEKVFSKIRMIFLEVSIPYVMAKHGAIQYGQLAALAAAQYGQVAALDWLSTHNVNFSAKNELGFGAAETAVRFGKINVLDWLLSHNFYEGSDLNAQIEITHDRVEQVGAQYEQEEGLIGFDSGVNARSVRNLWGYHLAMAAVMYGKIDVLDWLLTNNFKLDSRAVPVWAAKHRQLQVLKWLQDKNMPIDGFDDYYRPIHCAAENGDIEMLNWLYKNGLRIDALTEREGCQPAGIAAFANRVEVLEWLKQKGANLQARTISTGDTLCNIAAENGSLQAMRWLTSQGVPINARNNQGEDALLSSIGNGHLTLVNWLVENGADIRSRDNNGRTCLFTAARDNQLDIFIWLVEHGVTPDDLATSLKEITTNFAGGGWQPDIFELFSYIIESPTKVLDNWYEDISDPLTGKVDGDTNYLLSRIDALLPCMVALDRRELLDQFIFRDTTYNKISIIKPETWKKVMIAAACGNNIALFMDLYKALKKSIYDRENSKEFLIGILEDGIHWAVITGNVDMVKALAHLAIFVEEAVTISFTRTGKIIKELLRPTLNGVQDEIEKEKEQEKETGKEPEQHSRTERLKEIGNILRDAAHILHATGHVSHTAAAEVARLDNQPAAGSDTIAVKDDVNNQNYLPTLPQEIILYLLSFVFQKYTYRKI